MRKLLIALLSACLSLPALALPTAAPGYTTIMASNVVGADGTALASGTATFQVVDASMHPMAVQLGGFGQVHTAPVSVAVTGGAFIAQVVDVSQTAPSFPCVSLTIVDNSTGDTVLSYNCLQPTGATYDLDMFSTNTTPVVPQAGATLAGNLGVNGNLNVTGNLNMGGLNVGSMTSTLITSQNINGVLNAGAFSGADIGAKVNAAYATCPLACEVDIPRGTYTYSTDIVMPNSGSTTLRMAPGAILNYAGTGYAIRTSQGPNWQTGSYQGFYSIYGGMIFGTSSGKAGILLNAATSGIHITGVAVTGFTAGDGILDVGSNSVKIESSKVVQNLVGIHLMASPGFASNNVLVERTGIALNSWGVVNGDVSQWTSPWVFTGTTGVSSPNYNNTFYMDTFEGNTAGAVMDGLTVGSQYLNDYVEANPRGFVLGMITSPITNAQYTALYGVSSMNGGTSRDASVVGTFFTTDPSIHALVELRAAAQATIDRNGTDSPHGPAACFVDEYIATTPYVGQNDPANVGALLCVGGNPNWSSADVIPTPLAVTGNISTTGENNHLGPMTQNDTINPVAWLGGKPVFISNTDPAGTCGGAGGEVGGLWLNGDGLWVCQGTSPSATIGTWTKK
jgi:hypothetical protein